MIIILIRMNPFCEILKLNKILYSEKIDKEKLKKLLLRKTGV